MMQTRCWRVENRVSGRRARAGMTLIEVIISIAIFTTVILWTLSTLMSAVAANRILTANIAANSVILDKREELQLIAHGLLGAASAASDISIVTYGNGDMAARIISHYSNNGDDLGDEDGDNGLPLGPNGKIVPRVQWATPELIGSGSGNERVGLLVTFNIPEPGEEIGVNEASALHNQVKLSTGTEYWYNRGYGQMVIWMNETAVPVDQTIEYIWDDLGTHAQGKDAETKDGFDMNGDGKIERINLTTDYLKAGDKRSSYRSLPVDIIVRYYRDPGHTKPYFDNTRRAVISGVNAAAGQLTANAAR